MGTPARFTARSKARAKSRCEVNRSGPRLAYRIRMRWTTGACPPSGCGFLLIAVLPRLFGPSGTILPLANLRP
ncbi:hypothetical protein Afe04nite_68600 [Asanoa ferruginea]|nr:hypothetical protein Afe04nite_68600 [Asanoa ferruginea]